MSRTATRPATDTDAEPVDGAPDPAIPPAEDAAALRWVPKAIAELGVVAVPTNVVGEFTMDWGDSKRTDSSAGAPPVSHAYASAGAYTVTLTQGDAIVAKTQVVIRAGKGPAVTAAPAADNPNIIELTFADDPAEIASQYAITWNVGGVAEVVFAPKGTVLSHGYTAGDHVIVVRDLYTRRAVRLEVTVVDATFDPDFSATQGENTMTALVTLTAVATVKDVLVDWGDGQQSTVAAAEVGGKATHAYAANDTYIIQVVYADGSTDGSARTVTIPFPARDGRGSNRP